MKKLIIIAFACAIGVLACFLGACGSQNIVAEPFRMSDLEVTDGIYLAEKASETNAASVIDGPNGTSDSGISNGTGTAENTNGTGTTENTGATNTATHQSNNTGETVLTIPIASSYKAQPTPEFLYERADLVVVATYENDIHTICDQWGRPQTTSVFTILEVIKGDAVPNTTISAMYTGGKITLEEYMKTQTPGSLAKQGIESISEEEARNSYVEFIDLDAPMPSFGNNGQRYMLFLYYPSDVSDADYVIGDSGWAVLMINGENRVYSLFSKTYEGVSFYN